MKFQIQSAVALATAAMIAVSCSAPRAPAPESEEGRKATFREDCYDAVKLDTNPPEPTRAVFVLVDQTTGLDKGLRGTINKNLERLLGPGTVFSIAIFSARNNGRYATMLGEGQLQSPPPEDLRDDLPVTRLQRLDACLAQQSKGLKQEAKRQVVKATKLEASAFTSSEILASLTQLSEAVAESPADEKLVIVVSDLLEHSPATTFYSNKDLRKIDPAAELEKAREANLIGDFDGAQIAIVGAGLLSGDRRDAIRSTEALAALRQFWEQWIDASGGKIAQYGEPDLVTALKWSEVSAEDAGGL